MVQIHKDIDMKLAYAGVGSRETPIAICDLMRGIASTLSQRGWMLRSGHADGADISFEEGCTGTKEIYIPWQGFNKARHGHDSTYVVHCLKNHLQALDIAAQTHPNWKACSNAVQMLYAGTVYQIMGLGLNTPANMVICWTKDGNATAGTGQAIRLAERLSIPVFNLFKDDAVDKLQDFIYKTELIE
jgi:hypothetical protein